MTHTHSLRSKLTAAFLLNTLLVLLLVAGLANVLLNRQFTNYVMAKQQRTIDQTLNLLAANYHAWNGGWDTVTLESIGMSALEQGLILRVEDTAGHAVWDAQQHNSGMCAALLRNMAQNMAGRSPIFQGGYTEQRSPLAVDGQTVGTAVVGYYGPYYFSDSDVAFLDTLNALLGWVALAALLGSAALGIWMARRLSRPLRQVSAAAQQIASGHLDVRVQEPATTRETAELTETINRLAETLGRQEALRRRLTADVAHELRTPLATVQSHLEAMIDGVWQPEPARLRSCHEELLRLSTLVGDLERLTQVESQGLTLKLGRVNLSALLGRLAANFEGAFQAAGVELRFDPKETWVTADEDKMSQVLVNLIANALQHTPTGGSVTLEADGDSAVTVRDTGCGIAVEDLPLIFERFYRTDQSRSRATGGSGIGLSIARSIVEAHHGTITAESVPGQGSVFRVTLPRN